MKIFQKIMSFILVIGMVCGFAFAAPTTYADKHSISHAEAVDVLTAIGVVEGYPDGKFNPTGDVTRAEMAKMISVMVNKGKDINDRWINANAFADVTGIDWAAGHIAFAASEGYVAGRNAATFDPNSKVTGTEAAKMLLCVLGYDATHNGLVGLDWAKNTNKLASKAGLYESIDTDPTEALNRENAAQMMLNALEAPMVEFKAGSTTTVGGVTVVTGGEQKDLTNTATYFEADNVQYLVETLFEDLYKTSEADWAGRQGYTWNYGGKIGTYGNNEIFKTYTGMISLSTLYADLGEVDGDEFASISVYRNGDNAPEDVAAVAAMTKYSTMRDTISVPGATTEVYYDRLTKNLNIVEIVPFYGVIETVDEDNEEVTVEVDGTLTDTLEAPGYTEDDEETVVVCYVDEVNSEVVSIEKATVVSGILSNVSGGTETALTIGNKVYVASENVYDMSQITNYLGSNVTLYLDRNGFVLAVEATTMTTGMKYAYVIDTGVDNTIYAGSADKYAYLLFADGTHASVQVKNNSYVENLETIEGHIVAYTVKDGIYTLRAPANLTEGDHVNTITTGEAKIGNGVANNSSVFVVDLALDTDYNNEITITSSVYTGIQNVPNIEAADVAYLTDRGYIVVAFANNASLTMGYNTNIDSIYVTGNERSEAHLNSDEELVQYTEYIAIVDGKVTTVKVENDSDAYTKLSTGWNWFNGETIIDGFYTNINTTHIDTPTYISSWEKYKDGVVGLNGVSTYVEEDTVAYIYNAKTETITRTIVSKVGSRIIDGYYFVDTTALATTKPVTALYICVNG